MLASGQQFADCVNADDEMHYAEAGHQAAKVWIVDDRAECGRGVKQRAESPESGPGRDDEEDACFEAIQAEE